MFYQILKINLRKLMSDKAYSGTNLLGLTLGMTAFVLISLWVKDELTYDRFHDKADQLVRIVAESRDGEGGYNWAMATTPWLMAPALETSVPGVAGSARVWRGFSMLLENGDEQYIKVNPTLLDPSFFELFDFEALQGSPDRWLNSPNDVVLSSTMATQLFGEDEALGQSLLLQDSIPLTVSGVLEKMPSNSIFDYDVMLSSSLANLFKPSDMQSWRNWNFDTYLLLDKQADRQKIGGDITRLYQERSGDDEDFNWFVQGVADVHLYSNFEQADHKSSQLLSIYYLLGIAFMVLIIACINYTNLATARASKQTKTVSVRKIVGASRQHLFSLLLGESVLLTLTALCLSLVLLQLMFPLFNQMTGKRMLFEWWKMDVIGILSFATLLTILMSGIYPALMASSFSPIKFLQGIRGGGHRKHYFRHALLIGQFAVTAILIIATAVIFRQLNFLKDADLGYTKENIFTFRLSDEMRDRTDVVKQELLKHPSLKQVTTTNQPIYRIGSWTDGIAWPGHVESGSVKIRRLAVDSNFFSFFGLKVAAGDSFTANNRKGSYMINEEARKALGMDDPIGEQITLNRQEGKIIGLVEDFHIRSLREKIEPLIIVPNQRLSAQVFVRANGADMQAALIAAKEVWNTFEPKRPFEYRFLDQAYALQYQQEERIGSMLNVASLLCILIASIGLLGLVAFTLVQRTKEIGVRKVLGASLTHIISLLGKDFLRSVGIGVGIAVPLAWYFLKNWLNEFAYRIQLDIGIFLFSGLFVLLLAFFLLSIHAIRAVNTNPIEALRYE